MAEEPKDQKPPQLEPPRLPAPDAAGIGGQAKDIEELLKDLPKVDALKPLPSSPSSIPPPRPQTPSTPGTTPPPLPKPLTLGPPPPPTLIGPALPSLQRGERGSPPPREDKFKSLIRTMDEDLEAAKKGLRPEPKPFEIKPPPRSAGPPPGGPRIMPQVPMGTRPVTPEIKLGQPERTKTLEIPKALSPLPPRRKFSFSPKLLITALIILMAFGAGWYFLNREPEEVVIFTPTPTATPAPTPKTLSELITPVNQITISSTENFLNALTTKQLRNPLQGGFTALNIVDENGNRYSISQIFERLNIAPPNGLLENLDSGEWIIFAYGQQEMFDDKGLLVFANVSKTKLVLIAKTNNPSSLRSAINSWEATMTSDLKNLFGLNSQKAASEIFLDNIYIGTDIRYRNFPFADNTIDYAIVNLPEFNLNYFVLTNSRESMYSAVDLLRNQ